jgi:hypothetical protein
MAYGARLEDRLPKPDHQQLFPQNEFLFQRKLLIGSHVDDVTFRAVEDSEKLCAARDLLNDRYGWRGYGSSHSIPSGLHHTTFTAEVHTHVVGTITLAIDSDRGLAIDQTFKDEADEIRQEEGAHICELTKLAFHSGVRSKEVLAGLFHLVYIYGTTISDCTDLLIEINPRHASFYEMMLGFERVGALKTNGSVAAPSQLMRLRVESIRRNIGDLAGSAKVACHRSLYSYFFPPMQETQLRCQLSLHPRMQHVRCDSAQIGSYADVDRDRANFTGSIDPLSVALSWDAKTMGLAARPDIRRAA